NRFCKPNSGGVKVSVAKLRISRNHRLFEFRVAGVQGSIVEIWIGFERALVSRNRFVHVAAHERGFTFANRNLRSLNIREWNLSGVGSGQSVERHFGEAAVVAKRLRLQ